MSSDLYLNLKYDLKDDSFEIDTNIKQEKIKDIISDFLRSQIGKGKDDSKSNEHDIYEINLLLDLSCDEFNCNHNCGNSSLREGILIRYLVELR